MRLYEQEKQGHDPSGGKVMKRRVIGMDQFTTREQVINYATNA